MGMARQLQMSVAELLGWHVVVLWQTTVLFSHEPPQLKLAQG